MMALLASLLVLSATPAGKAEQAAELARRSMSEYNVGRFDVALDDATNAYLLDPRPGLLYNIGQCQRALHNWERAEFFYRGYLRDKPDASNRKAVEDLIVDMQAKQKQEAAA
jgi:tetratricopeptide (TPR) repeat protein